MVRVNKNGALMKGMNQMLLKTFEQFSRRLVQQSRKLRAQENSLVFENPALIIEFNEDNHVVDQNRPFLPNMAKYFRSPFRLDTLEQDFQASFLQIIIDSTVRENLLQLLNKSQASKKKVSELDTKLNCYVEIDPILDITGLSKGFYLQLRPFEQTVTNLLSRVAKGIISKEHYVLDFNEEQGNAVHFLSKMTAFLQDTYGVKQSQLVRILKGKDDLLGQIGDDEIAGTILSQYVGKERKLNKKSMNQQSQPNVP